MCKSDKLQLLHAGIWEILWQMVCRNYREWVHGRSNVVGHTLILEMFLKLTPTWSPLRLVWNLRAPCTHFPCHRKRRSTRSSTPDNRNTTSEMTGYIWGITPPGMFQEQVNGCQVECSLRNCHCPRVESYECKNIKWTRVVKEFKCILN